jgi:hypothetical protein
MGLVDAGEIRKIRRFGRFAQASCFVMFAMLAVMGPVTAVLAMIENDWALTATRGLGRYFTVGTPAPLSLAVWGVLDGALIFAIACIGVGYLYSLFASLGRGAIYTPDNVRRIRRIGQVMFALGTAQIVLPLLTVALMKIGAFPKPAAWAVDLDFGPDTPLLLVAGAVILLVSWIMEAGRRASDDAESMRREAELVV